MGDTNQSPSDRQIGEYRLDLRQRVLFHGADRVQLTPKALDTLAVLAARAGQVVAKSELMNLVWADTFVEENNLAQSISALRKALGGSISIETVPRRGYRLIVPDAPASAPPAPEGAPQTPSPRAFKLAALIAAAAVSFALILLILVPRRQPGLSTTDSVVVLPFVNLSGNSEDDYIADGLTEELTSHVSQIQGLRVIARTTAFQFKGKPVDVREIGRRLGVTAVLEGSVMRHDGRIRVTAQFNSTSDGYHLWAAIYNTDAGDLFAVQEEIASKIAGTLKRRLAAAGGAGHRPTESLQAHNLYLQGLYLRNTTDPTSVKRAVERFQAALHEDPNYAAPYAGLADCYSFLAWGRAMPASEAFPLARAAADRALLLDDSLAAAHTSRAIIDLVFSWDWKAAAREFRRALELNPSDAQAHHWLSHYSVVTGRLGDSLDESRRALDLDPLDLLVSAHLGWHYLMAGQYREAVAASEKTLELDPHNSNALWQMVDAYQHLDQYPNALAVLRRTEGAASFAQRLEDGWRTQGATGYWEAALKDALGQQPPDEYEIARIAMRLGRRRDALDALDRAFNSRSPSLIYLKHEAYFDPLANDPRFRTLIASMGLN